MLELGAFLEGTSLCGEIVFKPRKHCWRGLVLQVLETVMFLLKPGTLVEGNF